MSVERRVAQRKQVELNLTCRMPAIPRPATIHDISETGCRLEQRGAKLELGGTALLELPGLGRVAGHIVWNHGNVAGIHFERPISREEAIALGLLEPELEPEPELAEFEVAGPGKPKGILHHWFRR